MITFYCGKPGNGKTMRAVHDIVRELVTGDRVIVTNVSLKLPEIYHYIEKKYPKAFERKFCREDRKHISDWIVLLSDEQIRKFYLYRNNLGPVCESVSKEDWKKGVRLDYSGVTDTGVFAVIDEVHIEFNSRAWAETGAEVLYYLSQHRKLGDDVLCITQAVENVDKQFRSVTQDFWYFKHLSKMTVSGFRPPNRFIYQIFPCAVSPGSQVRAMDIGSFTMDVNGIASLYDTRKGVGIAGKAKADMGRHARGWDWKWLAVPVLLLCFLFWKGPKWIVSGIIPHNPVKTASVAGSSTQVPLVPVTHFSMPSLAVPEHTNQYFFAGGDDGTNDIFCTGFCALGGGRLVAFLSDGTTLESYEILTVRHRLLVCRDGTVYPIKTVSQRSDIPSGNVLPSSQPSAVEVPQSRYSPSDYDSTLSVIPRDYRFTGFQHAASAPVLGAQSSTSYNLGNP